MDAEDGAGDAGVVGDSGFADDAIGDAAANDFTQRLPADAGDLGTAAMVTALPSTGNGSEANASTMKMTESGNLGGPGLEATLVDVRVLIEEINRFRRDPPKYAEEMSKLRDFYRGHILAWPEGPEVETVEGVAALEDCLEDLKQAVPLAPVNVSQALSRSCMRHLGDLFRNDFCSHIGSDGSTPEERLSFFGEHREQCGENIVLGVPVAKHIVYSMLIDDGAPDRGHRANLMNGDFHFAGAAQGAHPSAGFAVVVLLVDQFKTKQLGHFDIMRNVIEGATGREVPMIPGASVAVSVQRAWDALQEKLKPAHLRVPQHLLDNTLKSDRPRVHRDKIIRMKKIPVGFLAPKPGVNPVIVRAFVHRIDHDHDDCIVEAELAKICHEQKLNVTVDYIAAVFDEISQRRPWHDRGRRSLSFLEIFNAMKASKKWMPSVDLHIKREGDEYQLIYAVEELEQLCYDIYREIEHRTEDVPAPPSLGINSRSLPRNTSGPTRLKPINTFLAALLTAVDADTGEPLNTLPSVQALFARPGSAGSRQPVKSAVCLGQRRLWAHVLRPYRDFWLMLHKAVGLQPLVPLPIHLAPSVLVEQPIVDHIDASQKDQRRRVRDRGAFADSKRAAASVARELPVSVWDRLGCEKAARSQDGAVAEVPAWDEPRRQSEALVNSYFLGTGAANVDQTMRADATAPSGVDGGSSMGGVTFAAKKRFNQNTAKLQRASEWQQQELGAVARSNSTPAAGIVAMAAAGMLGPGTHTASGLGPANHVARTRGAGAFPQAAPTGVRGHFHNTLAVHEKDNSHGYPQSLPADWDGSHIDHARAAPQKDCDNFGQPHGYAYMTKKQRAAQFNTYFKNSALGRGATHGTHDAFTAKAKMAYDQIKNNDPYKDWKRHEFREDEPARLCQFGRRDFDPQVKPNAPRRNVSLIDDKPMEQRIRERERYEDVVHRAMPRGQPKHFEQYLPTCRQPLRHEDMATRAPINCHMDGDQKSVALGFGQNRHSDHRDYKLYTRPVGASHLDKTLPLA